MNDWRARVKHPSVTSEAIATKKEAMLVARMVTNAGRGMNSLVPEQAARSVWQSDAASIIRPRSKGKKKKKSSLLKYFTTFAQKIEPRLATLD